MEYTVDEVYGLSRNIPLNYVERHDVDERLRCNLNRDKHITIFGSSKQGKTCLRKHCLNENDYILVQCSNRWSLSDLNANILKRAGYELTESTNVTYEGKAKVSASVKILDATLGGEAGGGATKNVTHRQLELDLSDVNDIIGALNEANFHQYIVLEDFHYLKSEVQKDFAIELKAFHESSNLCFIIVGVWLDENKLVIYNGDLTGRIVPVNADLWNEEELRKVIQKGEDFLNIRFKESFTSEAIEASSGNVYIVQETCHRACNESGIRKTVAGERRLIGDGLNARSLVAGIIQEQSGRYNTFITNYANGFQETTLAMHKWLLYPILTSRVEELSKGLTYRSIRLKITSVHPQGKNLNPGNITQALKAVSSLQLSKSIQPIILDYDESNLTLHIVDKGFLIWLSMQDRNELLSTVGLPEMT